ncbi:hypothetical protein A5819_003739 [Enterococcus sp. 7E2_DIV0204]|uniref:hypothetical protein n=1 Tax=unclassified Enterococcus TaxID=2608891 RepID=UPI000B722DFC|nr:MULTISPECIES: hypothetical protein [unclassified Enterococcus]OTN83759.1 hypothetical protein A5819_003739 [Enterococcus sp. 7E2_DIV0204]OTP47130.1 hypothetical protein A5884_003667 [Enterococcus sp. 7D2_DIV0200]
MPINYVAKKEIPYTIDWNRLFDTLNQYQFFKKKSIQEKFLLSWKERIIVSEKKSYEEINKIDLTTTEHFPIRILFGSCFIAWCAIHIDNVEKCIFQHQLNPITIDLSWFLSEHLYLSKNQQKLFSTEQILYSVTNTYSNFSYIPILIFSPTFHYPYRRVIDGNHRVEFAIKNGGKYLQAYALTEHFFSENPNSFLDSFSRDIFLFLCDMNYFYDNCNNRRNWKNKILGKSEYHQFLYNSYIAQS